MLAARPEIVDVSERGRIRWAAWFRREVVSRTRAGEGPTRVFREHGLGPEVIGRKRIERCMARWRHDADG